MVFVLLEFPQYQYYYVVFVIDTMACSVVLTVAQITNYYLRDLNRCKKKSTRQNVTPFVYLSYRFYALLWDPQSIN